MWPFRRRFPKLVKTVFNSETGFIRQRFKEVMAQDKTGELFGESYLIEIAKRREALNWRESKLTLFNLLLISVLFANLVADVKDVSVFGVSSRELDKVKEIIVVISASVSLLSGWFNYTAVELGVISKTWLAERYEDKAVRSFKALALPGLLGNSLGWVGPPTSGPRVPSKFSVFIYLIGVLLSVGVTILTVLLVPVVQIFVTWDVLHSSVLPYPWNVLVASYVVSAIVSYIYLSFFRAVPLPYKDYSLSDELTRIKNEQGEEAYKQRIADILKEWDEKKKAG